MICINDGVTSGALHQINSRGLVVPDDISVVGIGGSDIIDFFHPPLTVVRIPVAEIGRTAAQLLLRQVETGRRSEEHVVIPSEFIIRESTGPCRQ
ncbi:MAG: LacI family DNA-binding transcriptional regulator [Deltaproteobacteria bacterium]|nr:LacI family DNA-binding transcriptional regulator [Deltaproteobacteria bacterium]MBW1922988.1 LacI family DNA-binding transcriptional regulator [Deltaproteobacteria bacterium]MBW2009388.1 LacI family DNA-binding transcriptional regulator [Deltaproteobacteria bacterium]MBW2346771.1 LacI family DNA-binding transcriptional regulator [Deltaproteobacteria bacterium]